MFKFYSYFNTAKVIISNFKGEIPLSIYLKHFFNREKKYGSKDRKQITSLCYPYYRASKIFTNKLIDDKIFYSYFLCENKQSSLLNFFKPELDEKITLSLNEKLILLKEEINYRLFFPFESYLSEIVDVKKFNFTILKQPNLFIRIRPSKIQLVTEVLNNSEIPYIELQKNTLSLKNSTKIPELLILDQDYVVQDLSSQRVSEVLDKHLTDISQNGTVWDCCAASGGKSLMVFDQRPDLYFSVSDVRESILQNLKERFKVAGLKKFSHFVLDLNTMMGEIPNQKFDLIIADVPCSGSGTWARTPEQQYFFKEEQIEKYAHIQFNIVKNAIQYLKPNAIFVYITCSVFKAENEENVSKIKNLGLSLLESKLITGYNNNADTLFIAIFKSDINLIK